MLQRVIATMFVCYGILYVIPVMLILQDADAPVGRSLMWLGAGVVLGIGGAFVATGSGLMSNACWWRSTATGGAAASILLAVAGFPIPIGFVVVSLAVFGGLLHYWLRARFAAA